jgi:hypothetical protein
MEDPISKGNDLAKKVLENIEENRRKNQSQVLGRIILAKLADIFAVFISLIITGIVIYLFTESVFEGFISAVVGYMAIRYLFKKRNKSWFSWFFGWFEFNKS